MVFTEFLSEDMTDEENAIVSKPQENRATAKITKSKTTSISQDMETVSVSMSARSSDEEIMEDSSFLNIGIPKDEPMVLLAPKISVIGVGGAGGNAINTMINSELKGARFLVANTDAQALSMSYADCRIQLGLETTKGLGSGMNPAVGKAAAEEAIDKIIEEIKDANMLFIAVGMGGGTGTGAAPVIAKAAKELGILTVGVVTKPFNFEGKRRMEIAQKGIEELTRYVDTIIVIPNQNLFRIATEKTSFSDAFKMADNVLYSGVRNITDLIMVPGLINLDFADVCTVITEMGRAMMGSGEAKGDNRALEAAEAAITNQLLDDNSMKGAKGILINITGGMDLSLLEVDAAAEKIKNEVDPDANIIIGACLDPALEGIMRVSVVATGISGNKKQENLEDALSSHSGSNSFSSFSTGQTSSLFSAMKPISSEFPKNTEENISSAKDEFNKLFSSSLSDIERTTEEDSDPNLMSVSQAEVTVGITEQTVEMVIDDDIVSDEPEEQNATTQTYDSETNEDMPIVGTHSNPFGIAPEPIITIYDDDLNQSHSNFDIENDEPANTFPDEQETKDDKPYSGLFKRVTKFTLGRNKSQAPQAQITPLEQHSNKAPTTSHKKNETGEVDIDDLDIPAFLRRH